MVEGDQGMMTLVLALSVLWGVVGVFVYMYRSSQQKELQHQDSGNKDDKSTGKKDDKKKRRAGMGRVGRAANDVQQAQQEALNNTAVAGDPDQEEDEPLSKKEQRAKEKREAKQDARRERAEADDRKRDKQSMRDAKYADRDREREEMEAQLEKEEAEREAEREKLAEAELAEWKDMFSVGEAGNEADQEISESQGKLAEFIDHIEQQKVIAMEDLAAHFGMRPQAVLKRIEDLMAMGRLSGVIDDRGKFISITNEELKEVAKFIRRRGRVNVSDLAAESNKLIDLTPKPLPAAPANAPIEIVG